MPSTHAHNPIPNSLGQSLIPLVNKIQDVLLYAGLHNGIDAEHSNPDSKSDPSVSLTKNLPVIAVIGSQSSGKSSLLESLVGRDFLPKKNEICTKRPLVLQLVQSSGSEGGEPSYGEFLHRRNRKYYDFEQVKEEIVAETDRLVGNGSRYVGKPLENVCVCVQTHAWPREFCELDASDMLGVLGVSRRRRMRGAIVDTHSSTRSATHRSTPSLTTTCTHTTHRSRISSEPIRLRIVSPNVLTMTLVDLPGLTRVPVGDQPPDIEKQVRARPQGR